MKITVWMSERSLEQFKNKERVTGMISNREPGTHVNVFQVQLTLDEYYQLKDAECCGTGCCTSIDSETIQTASSGHESIGMPTLEEDISHWSFAHCSTCTPTECSLPDGAEWDVKYSLEEKPIECNCTSDFHCSCSDPVEDKSPLETWFGPNDRMRDIVRSTPNNMELGSVIRQLVNDSDE